MSVRKLTALGLLAMMLVAAALFAGRGQARPGLTVVRLSTAQSEFQAGVLNSGNWGEFNGGVHEVNNDNYVVGNFTGNGGLRVRNYFSFDASLLPGCARSASLQVPFPPGAGSGDAGFSTAGALYVLRDVATDAFTLNQTSGPNLAIFDDLGSGATYGSKFVPTVGPYSAEAFVIPLNTPAAIHDLNTAFLSGRFFSVGGMIAGEPVNTWILGMTPPVGPPPLFAERPTNLLVTVGPCNVGS
jgi:hypothetical protein